MMFHILHRTLGFEIVISIWFIKSSEIDTAPNMCQGNDRCCDGYFWNLNTNNCTECMPGYFGPNCTFECPYPSYGQKCQGKCDCDTKSCDASTGCTTLTTDDKTSSVKAESTDLRENTTFHSMENHASTFSGDGTSFSATIESTNFGEITTFDMINNSTSKLHGTYNHILILLIKGFGGVDILLICAYSVILLIDRYNQKSAFQTNIIRGHAPRTNSMYENIEIVFLPND